MAEAKIPRVVLDSQLSPFHAAMVTVLLVALDAISGKKSGSFLRLLKRNNGVLTVALELPA